MFSVKKKMVIFLGDLVQRRDFEDFDRMTLIDDSELSMEEVNAGTFTMKRVYCNNF